MDVRSTLLNGFLEDEVYVKQPSGYEIYGNEDKICKINKALYGLKQGPECGTVEFMNI